MITRRDAAKTILGAFGALSLPRGQVAAAAIPADLGQPPTELLPEWVMPIDARLFVVGFVDADEAEPFCVRAEVRVADDGAFDVAFFCARRDVGMVQVAGFIGTGQEPAGSTLSVILAGMMAAGRRGEKDYESEAA